MNELSPAYAPWGRRAGAVLVDSAVLLPIVLLIRLASHGHTVALVTLGLALVNFAYAGLFQSRTGDHNGQTLGQQWLRVRVTRDSGRPLGFAFGALRQALVLAPVFTFSPGHTLLRVASGLVAIAWYADWLWPLWDAENRALHDRVVGTHVLMVPAQRPASTDDATPES